MKSLEELKAELEALERLEKQEQERIAVEKRIKELKEKGTIKARLKNAGKKLHGHMQRVGSKYREEQEDKGVFPKVDYGSGWNTRKDLLDQPIKSPLNSSKKKDKFI